MNAMITRIIEESGKASFGLRVMTNNPVTGVAIVSKIGDTVDNSYNWVDGDTTPSQLDGVSAVQISYDGWEVEDIEGDLDTLAPYMALGHQIVLLGGTSSYDGNDPGETVIRGAEVLYIF